MAYDKHLLERISKILNRKGVSYKTKSMIGGLCFMVNDKMAVGVIHNALLARIDPDSYQRSLMRKGCRPMEFSGRVMKGFICVDAVGIEADKDLEYWIQVCLDFNPKARATKKS